MTNQEVFRKALELGLAKTPTEFWQGQRQSGLDPEAYLSHLRERLQDTSSVRPSVPAVQPIAKASQPSRKVRITTGQIGKVRPSRDVMVIDITVKSGRREFAPTWEMVMSYKDGRLSESGYTRQYEQMMLGTPGNPGSWERNFGAWQGLLQQAADRDVTIILVCYCRRGDFCHRHLLKEYLRKFAERHPNLHLTVEVLPEG